eukprot:8322903-Prorocentrum_lima.AAC.1
MLVRAKASTDGTPGESYEALLQSAEYIRVYAANGGLTEINAVCEAYCIQVVVCARAEDKFIVLGKEGRRTATL